MTKELEFLAIEPVKSALLNTVIQDFKFNEKLKFFSIKDSIFFQDYNYLKTTDNNKFECMLIAIHEHKSDTIGIYGEDAFNYNALVLLLNLCKTSSSFRDTIKEEDMESFDKLLDFTKIDDDTILEALNTNASLKEKIEYITMNSKLLKLYKVNDEHLLELEFRNKGLSDSIYKVLSYQDNFELSPFQLQEYRNFYTNDYSFVLVNIMLAMGFATMNVGLTFSKGFNIDVGKAEYNNTLELNHDTITINYEYLKHIMIHQVGPIIDIHNALDAFKLLRRCFELQGTGDVTITKDNKQVLIKYIMSDLEQLFEDTTSTSSTFPIIRTACSLKVQERFPPHHPNGEFHIQNPFVEMLITLLHLKHNQFVPSILSSKEYDLNKPSITTISDKSLEIYELEVTRYLNH